MANMRMNGDYRDNLNVFWDIYKDRDEYKHEKSLDDVVFKTREEAEEALEFLKGLVEDYGYATAADLFHIAGRHESYYDMGWGWQNLDDSKVKNVERGYKIDLPKIETL